MRLKLFRSLWGVIKEAPTAEGQRPFHEALRDIKAMGYSGVEVPLLWAYQCGGKENFSAVMHDLDLELIPMILTNGPVTPHAAGIKGYPAPDNTPGPGRVQANLDVFKAQVEDAFGGGWSPHDPTFANSHSISDFFRAEEAADFFDAALSWQEEQGLPPVYHETHRKRWLHSPWVCRDFVLPNYRPAPPPPPTAAARAPPAAAVEGKADTRLPLGLVADLSHFCVVAETSPSDPELCAVVEALSPYVRHVHARVGYDHGPQVGDPREPYWEEYVKGHERWWDQIWEAQALAGQEVSTMTMEFGPPNYQHTDPKTGEPLADVWEVNHWMARRLQARFANKYGVENTSSVTSLYSINP